MGATEGRGLALGESRPEGAVVDRVRTWVLSHPEASELC
jgi:hypothetical protein